nr:FHA domain-containing protein [uncultured Bacteroides sp.]
MIQREITIGRAPDSDILYNQNCVHVSNAHAVIYSNGNQLIFKDTSTNGTLINNMQIHHQSTVINYGDAILLAGKYPLAWEKIEIFFPQEKRHSTQFNDEYNPNAKSKTIVNPTYQSQTAYTPPTSNEKKAYTTNNNNVNIEVEITRFNWGAFFLYPLWGFANGMWWLFLISLFFGWLFPIPNLIFGIMGSKWAWQKKQWRNPEHYITVQDSWKKWGIGIFLLNVFLTILFVVILMAMASAF